MSIDSVLLGSPKYETDEQAQKAMEDALLEIQSLRDSNGNPINTAPIVTKILTSHTHLINSARGNG